MKAGAKLFGVFGGVSLDPDAAAFISLRQAAGETITPTKRAALDTFYKTAKTGGWYSSLKRLYLPTAGIAAANAICMVSRTSGTFAGTVTHGSGFVKSNGSTGYFDFGSPPASLGLTLASASLFTLVKTAHPSTAVISHMGAVGDAGGTIAAELIAAIGGNILRSTIGSGADANGYVDTGLTAPNQSGILFGGRFGGVRYIRRRTTSGTSELAAETEPDTGTIPTVRNMYAMCRNYNGSPVFFTTAEYGAYGVGTGMTSANAANFTAALKTLWETCTGLSLP